MSVFLDDSGIAGMKGGYYLSTLVAHDQDRDICPDIAFCGQSLQAKGLPSG